VTVDLVLLQWVVIWFIAAAFVLYRRWRTNKGVGLLLTYVLMFGMLHWLGTVLYFLPWFDSPWHELTREGSRLAAYAMIAFAVGTEAGRWLPGRDSPRAVTIVPERKTASTRAIKIFLATGVVLYAVVTPFADTIPSLSAIAATGSLLVVTALSLTCWNAWRKKRPRRFWAALVATSLLPLVTVAIQGFLGYGFAAMLCVFAFVASFYRPRWKVMIVGLAFAYLGASVFVTYMRDREEIRGVVWRGSGFDQRLSRISDTVRSAEWFNIYDTSQLERIHGRLNQNYLLGASVKHLEEKFVQFEEGRTLLNAALAIVPRALWPDKPITAGSGQLVTKYTGVKFAVGTSVGVGQIMELYINFGIGGVVIGFLVIGAILVRIDGKAARALHRGDARHFVLWYLPGLSLLQIGGSFVDVTSTAAGGLVVAHALCHFMGHLKKRKESASGAALPAAS
jgi:hypothetical protein